MKDMKQMTFLFVIVLVAALFVGCKYLKPQPLDGPGMERDSTAYEQPPTITEMPDTTPMPMFLIGGDKQYMHMLYWTEVEEPKKTADNADYFDGYHRSWELQDRFRRHAAEYTNLLVGDKTVKMKFVDEVLKDPDGKTPSMGQIHHLDEIPSLCARFAFADRKKTEQDEDEWGKVLVADSYLQSRQRLDIKSCMTKDYQYPALDATVDKQMEDKYGMKASRSAKHNIIGKRYTHGIIQFEGEYKEAPKDPYDPDRKFALAIEVLTDSGKVYAYEALGHYDPSYGATWNVDDEGMYIPNDIVAAFEGPKGLELCYTHPAPESFGVGMFFVRDGKLVREQYELFQSMVDEEKPVWKTDVDKMRQLYVQNDPHERKDITLSKWSHAYVDYQNEWIWLRDKDDKNGAFFIRNADGTFRLVAVETERMKPVRMEGNGMCYLKLSGPAGGPSYYTEVYAFKDGRQTEHFTVLEVEGEVSDCSLNGKEISKEEGKAYKDRLPSSREIFANFKNVE